jgi:hypothetical protein
VSNLLRVQPEESRHVSCPKTAPSGYLELLLQEIQVYQAKADMLSPTPDNKPVVIQAYGGHPSYSCSKCSAVIVGVFFLRDYFGALNCVIR